MTLIPSSCGVSFEIRNFLTHFLFDCNTFPWQFEALRKLDTLGGSLIFLTLRKFCLHPISLALYAWWQHLLDAWLAVKENFLDGLGAFHGGFLAPLWSMATVPTLGWFVSGFFSLFRTSYLFFVSWNHFVVVGLFKLSGSINTIYRVGQFKTSTFVNWFREATLAVIFCEWHIYWYH